MESFTKELAEALGYRDRLLGKDCEAQGETLDRFRSKYNRPLKRLQHAYRRGWREADLYCDNCWRWGAGSKKRVKVHPLLEAALHQK